MRSRPWLSTSFLLLFIILENLCLYYFFRLGVWTTGKNAICLFLSSLLFGLVFIYRFYDEPVIAPLPERKYKWLAWLSVSVFLIGVVLIGMEYNDFFREKTVENAGSDVILLIRVACRRLMAGEYPYKVVTDFGFPQDMTYLPLHWMPICVSQFLGIDDRWIPYTVWCIAALVICMRSARIPNLVIRAAVPLLLLASNYVLFCNNKSIVESTVELMIAGYYMLLIAGFNTRNGWFQGVMIGCCLLSRYSLLLWLPLYAFVLYTSGNRRQLYIAVATASAMVLFIYVIPFMNRDPGIFYNGYKYYDRAAFFEWTHLNVFEKPIQLFSGTGFAYCIYTRFPGLSIRARIALLQKVHVVVCLAVTLFMALWYRRNKDKIDQRLFLMGSFKIYLTFFLFLIQVPYAYLMCVGNFISIVLFSEQARYRLRGKAE